LGTTWGKFYYPHYLCETIMCMKIVHNSVLILSLFSFDLLRVYVDVRLLENKMDSDKADRSTRCKAFNRLIFGISGAGSAAFSFIWLVKDCIVLYGNAPGVWTLVLGIFAAAAAGIVVNLQFFLKLAPVCCKGCISRINMDHDQAEAERTDWPGQESESETYQHPRANEAEFGDGGGVGVSGPAPEPPPPTLHFSSTLAFPAESTTV
jgi:hypothetical protein